MIWARVPREPDRQRTIRPPTFAGIAGGHVGLSTRWAATPTSSIRRARRPLRAGSSIVSNSVHLHSNGRDTKAHLEIGFKLAPVGLQADRQRAHALGNGVDIDIRPNEANQQLHAYAVTQTNIKASVRAAPARAGRPDVPGSDLGLQHPDAQLRRLRPQLGARLRLRGRRRAAPAERARSCTSSATWTTRRRTRTFPTRETGRARATARWRTCSSTSGSASRSPTSSSRRKWRSAANSSASRATTSSSAARCAASRSRRPRRPAAGHGGRRPVTKCEGTRSPLLLLARRVGDRRARQGSGPDAQSLTYSSGQDVSPAFEGWEKNADGSFNFLFGYMNRNWQEEDRRPRRTRTTTSSPAARPGAADAPAAAPQPVHVPRARAEGFRPEEVVWTLTTHGKTNKAYATLRADCRIENIDIMSETGALGAGTSNPEIRADKPPVVEIEGDKDADGENRPARHVVRARDRRRRAADRAADSARRRVRQPADAVVAAQRRWRRDGGPPHPGPPARLTVSKTLGLHAAWFVCRGAGKVTFTPDQIEVWEDTREGANGPWAPRWQNPPAPADGKWTAQATFHEPGDLRASLPRRRRRAHERRRTYC